MTAYDRFSLLDLFSLGLTNIDRLTETYSVGFYGLYLTQWPECSIIARHSTSGQNMGYVIGKVEGEGEDWHGHVSAVTVASPFRRQGLARLLMCYIEAVSDKLHKGYFVDLFVRKSNNTAQIMYEKLGYIVYRRVLKYYQGSKEISDEDALDMRKPMTANTSRKKSAVIPLKHPILPHQLEWQ